jgi:hypothetical protein
LEQVLVAACTAVVLRMRIAEFVPVIWRAALATMIMAAFLWLSGLGWGPAPSTAASALVPLIAAVTGGAACYVASLALLWAAAGCPAGAETDAINLLRRAIGAGAARLPRRFRFPA